MTAVWDPDRVLNVRGRGIYQNGIQCNGANGGYGPRCGWTKGRRLDEAPDVRRAEALLHSLAARPPTNISMDTLEELAWLCLCRDHHQDQMRLIAQKWDRLVRSAAAKYVPPAPVPVPAPAPAPAPGPTPTPAWAPLVPASATSPATVPAPVVTFDSLQWKSADWQSVLVPLTSSTAQVKSPSTTTPAKTPSPPPTQPAIQTAEKPRHERIQHANAPTKPTTRARSPSRERTNSELQAALVKLSALQIQNTELRDQEQRLKVLEKEYADFKQSTTTELAGAQVKIVTLEKENKNFREEADRLQALEAEYSQSSQESNDALVWSQDQLSTLQTQHTDLSEEHETLAAEYAALKEQAAAQAEEHEKALRSQAEAVEIERAEALAKAERVYTEKALALADLQSEYHGLQNRAALTTISLQAQTAAVLKLQAEYDTLQSEHTSLKSKYAALRSGYTGLEGRHLALEASHAGCLAETHMQAANMILLQDQIAALSHSEAQLRAEAQQRDVTLQDTRDKLGYALRLADEVVSVSFAAAGRRNTKFQGRASRLVKKAGARTVGKVKDLGRSKGRTNKESRGVVAVNEKVRDGSSTGSNPDLHGRQTSPVRTTANVGVLPARSKRSVLGGVQGWLKKLGPRS
ncbi:uncharacterized protein C8A04DRAFT_31487 [Dichotomopilus funicola]|uniref:Uncharacterized protein n=1 Tax=Dichotomopilus funicola TaxID=1934379 RepID=A0AAN6UZV4_9PEZI|nr:hypothetical protein C8A04DRAFT_31487 [Dichotomopilus funicola]